MLIEIEGIDGSGKGTQAQRLCERLRRSGRSVELLSFPRYEATLFGRAVGQFLNGRYGTLENVHPFLVSLLFAGDRFESKPVLEAALRKNDVVVLDRYVYSNVAHQASKRTGAERADLTRQILQIEHEIYGLPRADIVLWLDVPVTTAQHLIAKKAARSYTEKAADLQEADGKYLQGVRSVYAELAASSPEWRTVECCPAGMLRSLDEVEGAIWDVVNAAMQGR